MVLQALGFAPPARPAKDVALLRRDLFRAVRLLFGSVRSSVMATYERGAIGAWIGAQCTHPAAGIMARVLPGVLQLTRTLHWTLHPDAELIPGLQTALVNGLGCTAEEEAPQGDCADRQMTAHEARRWCAAVRYAVCCWCLLPKTGADCREMLYKLVGLAALSIEHADRPPQLYSLLAAHPQLLTKTLFGQLERAPSGACSCQCVLK